MLRSRLSLAQVKRSVSVVTVANDLYGIEAGRTVDLTVVYLDLPRAWLAALPPPSSTAVD